MATSQHKLRFIRPVPDPIPWYLRVGYNDHKLLEERLSAGDTRINRVVFDAAFLDRHIDLLTALQKRGAELVLDPRSAELALPAGQKASIQRLPWAGEASAPTPAQYTAERQRTIAEQIAETALEYGFTAVLAPTHYLERTNDPWINVDAGITQALRRALDEVGGRHVRIYYPLLIPYAWLASRQTMISLAGMLSALGIDAVWLRVSNFYNDKSASSVRHYIEGARSLLTADRPLIADYVGGLAGLAIVAFGAAGGIAHGIGVREGFRVANWKQTNNGGFGMRKRVYVADADMYVDAKTFGPVLDNPVIRSRMGCKNKHCCPRGLDDMFGNVKGHLISTRLQQLALIADSTESQRASTFLRQALIPTGANLIKLDHALKDYPVLQEKIQRKRRFVDDLTSTLQSLNAETATDERRSSIPRRASFNALPAVQQNNQRPSL